MAFLAPLAAGAVSKTAGAAALAKAAGGASSLASGITAGAALGKGAMATMPALSYAGTNLAAPGILGALPSAVAPTAGIFAKAAPALGGLKAGTTIPALTSAAPGIKSAAAPGLFNTMGMSPLGGMNSVLPAGTAAPNVAGIKSLLPDAAKNVASTGTNYLTEGVRAADGLKINPITAETPITQGPLALQQAAASGIDPTKGFLSNALSLAKNPSMKGAMEYIETHPYASAGAAYMAYNALQPKPRQPVQDKGMIRPYEFEYNPNTAAYDTSPVADTSERMYFNPTFTALEPYRAAEGGLMGLAVGGPVETMSAMNSVGGNMMYPQAGLQTALYSNPQMQRPESVNVISPGEGPAVGSYTGEQKFADGGQINMQGTLNLSQGNPAGGQFGQANANGYQAAGSGAGLDPRAIAADPQGFARFMNNAAAQERGMPGSTFLGQGMGGLASLGSTMLGRGFASGGETSSPKTEGQYKYSYDPKTFVMTQIEAPRYADSLNKNLRPLDTGSKTSGGVAPPVGGPGIAALMPQTQAMPLNIPAYQSPEERLGLTDFYAMMNRRLAAMGGYAAGGGVSDLGGYSDGGRLLKGPGDGVSDSIPAVIGNRQPARLADGEFVVPARIVSELGNGSTEAGARKLYAMMDRVQKARRRTVGKDRVAANTKADKYLPA